jgi:magnesium chelatase family protein
VLATIPAATLHGVRGRAVDVEVHVGTGLPGLTLVGLPDVSCREAKERVRAALASAQVPWPGARHRIVVNLAPSALRKTGAGLDLAVAVGLLVATGEVPPESVTGLGFVGELGLDGSVRAVPGAISLVDAVAADTIVVARAAAVEAALVGRPIHAIESLAELVSVLRGDDEWPAPPAPLPADDDEVVPDLADVRGQPVARYALEVAAAGAHHLLMVGPPGAGKTMLAQRLPGLLPHLSSATAIEATRVHSVAGVSLPRGGLVRRAPFRAPHHSASAVSLVGGGSTSLRPGEISLAHGGVLFLDEIGEFDTRVLEALREPLEEGVVHVSRVATRTTMPARFLLVAAMNPCPCGFGGAPGGCVCSDAARARYRRRLSGPLLDRFDLRVEVSRPDVVMLVGGDAGESTASVAERVRAARERALVRGVDANAELRGARVDEHAPLSDGARQLLLRELQAGRLSARGAARVRVVALTIADLRGDDPPLGTEHLAVALGLRTDVGPLPYRAVG